MSRYALRCVLVEDQATDCALALLEIVHMAPEMDLPSTSHSTSLAPDGRVAAVLVLELRPMLPMLISLASKVVQLLDARLFLPSAILGLLPVSASSAAFPIRSLCWSVRHGTDAKFRSSAFVLESSSGDVDSFHSAALIDVR